tara:strand:- start:180 stop:995 length:816 start_codon:yes stop_codon:yes gene_type:complete
MKKIKWQTYKTIGIKEKYTYRYLSLEKLIHFLETGSIYLSRLDKFEDNLEGISPYEIKDLLSNSDNAQQNLIEKPHVVGEIWNSQIKKHKEIVKLIREKLIQNQKDKYVSCWILGDVESIGMWDLYGKNGFVIRFEKKTFQNLIKKNISHPRNINKNLELIISGKVIYQNFDEMETMEKESLLKYSVFRKHLSFKHEKEYRVVGYSKDSETTGIEYFLGNPNQLDFQILTSPRMNKFTFDTYKKILLKYINYTKISPSKLKIWLDLRNLEL